MAREIFVDLSSFQKDLTVDDYKQLGVNKAIVKISESTNYVNPYIHDLVDKAAAGGVNGFAFYHFGRFTNDAQASSEAKYFIDNAKSQVDVKPGTLMVLDAEIKGMPTSSAIVFLKALRDAGFKTGFYTYKYLLPNFDLEAIKPYMDWFWLAAYVKENGAADDKNPDFNYFPAANYVDAWQYTNNLLGYKVDGSITVTDNGNDVFNANNSSESSESNTVEKAVEKAVENPSQPAADPAQPQTWVDAQGDKWVEEHGTFISNTYINLRWGAKTISTVALTIGPGTEIKYDAYSNHDGYVWLRQPRSGGGYLYLVGRNAYTHEPWGTFK